MFDKKSPEAVVTARACTYVSRTHVRIGSPEDRRGQTIDIVDIRRAPILTAVPLSGPCVRCMPLSDDAALILFLLSAFHSVHFPKRRCRSFGIYTGFRTILHILHVHFIESREITRISGSGHICVAGLRLHALWSALT